MWPGPRAGPGTRRGLGRNQGAGASTDISLIELNDKTNDEGEEGQDDVADKDKQSQAQSVAYAEGGCAFSGPGRSTSENSGQKLIFHIPYIRLKYLFKILTRYKDKCMRKKVAKEFNIKS